MPSPAGRGLYLASVLSAILFSGLALAEPGEKTKDKSKFDPDKKNNLDGRARWVWTLSNAKGKVIDRGAFVAHRTGQIFHGDTLIGAYTSLGAKQVQVRFTQGALKGSAELHMTQANPARYQGSLEQKEGKRKLVVQIIND